MPVITASIDPITRIEGHLKVDVKIDTVNGVQQVVEAYSVGTMFRGFEKILEGRAPRDATIITSRICGVCPTSHGMASALVVDAAYGTSGDTPARTASRLLRNLVHGACYLESAILHFYLLSLPDYIPALPMAPWLPGWDVGRRFDPATLSRFTNSFVAAVAARRNCHEMGAIYGGKLPHTPAYLGGGGFTAIASAANNTAFGAYLDELISFIETKYIPDAELLANLYSEYLTLGKGYGHLLAFGVFELDNAATPQLLFKRGRMVNGNPAVQSVDVAQITEHIRHSWYSSGDKLNPAVGDTVPQYPKDGAYSWLKAPRYGGVPYEVGPVARMTINGDYSNGVSTMDRHLARAREARKIALAMKNWLAALVPGQTAYTDTPKPTTATGEGLTEAPRGALGHWLQVDNSVIAKYQVVTPTCWNLSPKDSDGQRGPLEQALIGVPVANVDKPIEVLRVVHSYDPCLDCAVHVSRAEPGARVFALGGIPEKH
jgi:hydrogenase large subunit